MITANDFSSLHTTFNGFGVLSSTFNTVRISFNSGENGKEPTDWMETWPWRRYCLNSRPSSHIQLASQ
jgi:hypothetical protein